MRTTLSSKSTMSRLPQMAEWDLLCELGRLFDRKKQQYKVQPLHSAQSRGKLYIRLIDCELRSLFMLPISPPDLSDSEYATCHENLSALCHLLDVCARPLRADSHPDKNLPSYPRLRALCQSLRNSNTTLDLVHGSNTNTLFALPHDSTALLDLLNKVLECNQVLGKLLESCAPETLAPYTPDLEDQSLLRRRKRGAWRHGSIREESTLALDVLFERFQCGMAHEVLLGLVDDLDEEDANSGLQFMLSRCPKSESWFEVRFDRLSLGTFSIISDICADLPECPDQCTCLVLRMERYDLYGAWADSTPIAAQPPRESLQQLIAQGHFLPPFSNINAIMNNSLDPQSTFTIREKLSIAVKLGFCLMNFFDADMDAKRVYFLRASSMTDNTPYLSFDSKFPSTKKPYPLHITHFRPIFTSFAKMLLEIHSGQDIELNISPGADNEHSSDAWLKLLKIVDRIGPKHGEFFVRAARNCLLVDWDIAKALQDHGGDARAADRKIRRIIYENVISELELGLEESETKPKRRRSEVSVNSDRSDSPGPLGQIGPSTQPGDVDRLWSTSKRQRAHNPQQSGRVSSLSRNSEQRAESRTEKDAVSTSSAVFPPRTRTDFKIAIVCALEVEYDAVSLVVDEFWEDRDGDRYGRARGDPNCYRTGRIGRLNVVLLLLPIMGKASAASSASSLQASYTELELVLLVGVCGGVPHGSKGEELLLGDVVISDFIFQYDYGRWYPGGFKMKDGVRDALPRLPKNIRNLVRILRTTSERKNVEERAATVLESVQAGAPLDSSETVYRYPGTEQDRLFAADFHHKHHSPSATCQCSKGDNNDVCEESLALPCELLGCIDSPQVMLRQRLAAKRQLECSPRPVSAQNPSIFVGSYGSGDTVLRSAKARDEIAQRYELYAFEMEGAGIWDDIPTLIIKGICDYCDSHKSKGWQNFASATAASVMKAILERYPKTDR